MNERSRGYENDGLTWPDAGWIEIVNCSDVRCDLWVNILECKAISTDPKCETSISPLPTAVEASAHPIKRAYSPLASRSLAIPVSCITGCARDLDIAVQLCPI